MSGERQRVDVWLWRARLAKTRAAAARMVSEGGVRVSRDGASRHLDKPSSTIAPGDALSFPDESGIRTIEIAALGARRGSPAEARTLFRERGAD